MRVKREAFGAAKNGAQARSFVTVWPYDVLVRRDGDRGKVPRDLQLIGHSRRPPISGVSGLWARFSSDGLRLLGRLSRAAHERMNAKHASAKSPKHVPYACL